MESTQAPPSAHTTAGPVPAANSNSSGPAAIQAPASSPRTGINPATEGTPLSNRSVEGPESSQKLQQALQELAEAENLDLPTCQGKLTEIFKQLSKSDDNAWNTIADGLIPLCSKNPSNDALFEGLCHCITMASVIGNTYKAFLAKAIEVIRILCVTGKQEPREACNLALKVIKQQHAKASLSDLGTHMLSEYGEEYTAMQVSLDAIRYCLQKQYDENPRVTQSAILSNMGIYTLRSNEALQKEAKQKHNDPEFWNSLYTGTLSAITKTQVTGMKRLMLMVHYAALYLKIMSALKGQTLADSQVFLGIANTLINNTELRNLEAAKMAIRYCFADEPHKANDPEFIQGKIIEYTRTSL